MQSIKEELLKVKHKIREAKRLERQKEYRKAAREALEAAEILTNIAKREDINEKLKEQLCDRAEKVLTWVRILKDTTVLKTSLREKRARKAITTFCEPKIRSVYLIYEDGTPIYFHILDNMPSDPLLVSGALAGISTLIREITQTKSGLKRIDYGDGEIIFERGKKIIMAVFTTLLTEEMRNKIAKAIKKIETRYEDILENWNGDLSKFGDLRKELEELLESK
ncbi:MAG: hypothetical protein B6U95_05740 [Thermofilum sp. ex4484_82]|nr:MAG: hypothetical protein B6U95_05740 [Thermofilum sp. ex4484_82]OYT37799.1 MAG: hypothetical protein B6U96_05735 [Archaeoglobales archaeon ex4484_92]